MSSSMRNFVEAYHAVHSQEAKEELTSGRDAISEMNLSVLTDNDLNEIVEEVLEDIFESGLLVNEVHNIFSDMFVESDIVGRQQKIDRLCEALNTGFDLVESKAPTQALEEFRKYRHNKKLQESWSDRFNQEKRVKKHHGAIVAQEALNVKNLLTQMFNSKNEEFKALTPDKKDRIRNQAERRGKDANRKQSAGDYPTSTRKDQEVRKMKSVLNNEVDLDFVNSLIESGKFSDEEIEKIVEAQVARNNPEKYEGEQDKKLERDKPYAERSKAAQMADPKRGINSPAFKKFMQQQGA